MSKKQIAGFISAGAIIAAGLLLPEACLTGLAGLTLKGARTLALLAAFLATLITEAAHPLLLSLIFTGLMPLAGVTSTLSEALSGYSSPLALFIVASFGIACAFSSVPAPKRILRALLRRFGGSSEAILLALMLCTALVSSVLSNVPCGAMFMALGKELLGMYEAGEARRRSGRAFMIAIPVATMIGGCITPPGSSVNMLAISMLERYTGRTIGFMEWTFAGLPFAALALPLSWLLICKIHKPAPIAKDAAEAFISGMVIPASFDGREKRVLTAFAVLLVLFAASSWIKGLDIILVAALGCCFMCLPFAGIISADDLSKA
jgi:sodium-dependent dicarboxylate transporter 2/3/5